ncbi:MAG: rhamnulokinase family protein [Thermomicrobiales bacterium]
MSVLAFDIGASSGRAYGASLAGDRLHVDEIARFPNGPVRRGSSIAWDYPGLLNHIMETIRTATTSGIRYDSLGIVTWGLDFGIVDADGGLVELPRHHRDPRNITGMRRVLERIDRRDLFEQSGIQHMRFNSLFHLAEMAADPARPLDRGVALLQIPDLLNHALTGIRQNEYTNATTTQLIDIRTGDWNLSLFDRIGVPRHLVHPVTHAPASIGPLRSQHAAGEIDVITVASHDTASAVIAAPLTPRTAFLSCGTWSLLGAELGHPILTDRAFALNVSNEGGVAGTTRLLKNIMGLWILESCRRAWDLYPSDPHHLIDAAREAVDIHAYIDPDDPAFEAPDSMPDAIWSSLAASGQELPSTRGEIVRVILQSLALKYRYTLDLIESAVGERFDALQIVGGGANNALLCQWTANAIGRPVLAGPVEATMLGNVAMQLLHRGDVSSVQEFRAIVQATFPPTCYEPRDGDDWDARYEHFQTVAGREPAAHVTATVEEFRP